MNEQSKYSGKYSDWVDRYVRDELSDEEVVVFEEHMIKDTRLQSELEAVLGIKEALKLDIKLDSDSVQRAETTPGRNQWSSLAIAASVLLAITSTTFYWRTSVEAGRLQEQLTAAQAPRSTVLNVPVHIMRSAGSATPDVIIQKPSGRSVILLEIELSARFQGLDSIEFQLNTDDSTTVLNWTAVPTSSGWASVVLNSEVVPEGLVHLQISDPSSELRENRLLEFRKPLP